MSKQSTGLKISSASAVIPAFRASREIRQTVQDCLDSGFQSVVVVDDGCPEGTADIVESAFGSNSMVHVLRAGQNGGVGAATILGIKWVLANTKSQIVVKLDADGQMLPDDAPKLIRKVSEGAADFAKANRFHSPRDFREMPRVRVFGNAVLSLLSKASSGYWSINDPTNGFFAVSRLTLETLELDRISKRFFFESDLLFRLRLQRARVVDVPIKARYREERSNLSPVRVLLPFLVGYLRNFFKRIAYQYFIREWSIGTVLLPVGLTGLVGSISFGLETLSTSLLSGVPASVGSGVLVMVPALVSLQILLTFIQVDIQTEPK